MVIHTVVLANRAKRDLLNVPAHIAAKLRTWIASVELEGLENVRKVPGYHDEPLEGKRKGQRSIRLSRHYRAIYEIQQDNAIRFVSVKEVTKHEY